MNYGKSNVENFVKNAILSDFNFFGSFFIIQFITKNLTKEAIQKKVEIYKIYYNLMSIYSKKNISLSKTI